MKAYYQRSVDEIISEATLLTSVYPANAPIYSYPNSLMAQITCSAPVYNIAVYNPTSQLHVD